MGAEGGEQTSGHIGLSADVEALDFRHRQYVAGGGGHEDGVGDFQIGGKQVAFADGDSIGLNGIEQNLAGDAREAAGIEGRGDNVVAEDGEEVGGGTLADAAVFVEKDNFVEAAFVGFLVPG